MDCGLFKLVRDELGADALKCSMLWNEGERWLTEIVERQILPTMCGVRPKFVEIGCRAGTSAAILARYGHVTCFDIKDRTEWASVQRIGRQVCEENGLTWYGVDRHILASTAEIVAALDGVEFNVAHEDSSHRYEDLQAYWPYLSRAMHIIFHDFDGSQPDVSRFVRGAALIGTVERCGVFGYWRRAPKQEAHSLGIPESHFMRQVL